MNLSGKIFAALISCLVIVSVFSHGQEKEKPVKIPEEVDNAIQASLSARQPRLDIPLSYVNTFYFPYQTDYFSVFFLRIKNRAFGYAAPSMEEQKQKEEAKEKIEQDKNILSCSVDFFFRIYSLDKKGQVKGTHKEIYLPFDDQVKSKEYNPEEENVYSFGTIFPPGRYLLCAAAASLDLTRIGLIFQEFYLPFSSDFKKNLGLTPLFFIKSMKRMPSPDSMIKLYKNVFHYSVLEIEPHFDHEFSLKEKLDIFYFIQGGAPAQDGKFTFEIGYVYKKGEEEVIKFKPREETIPAPIVSIPLQLFFEEKKLEPGEYILEITIKDKVSKKEGKGKIPFFTK